MSIDKCGRRKVQKCHIDFNLVTTCRQRKTAKRRMPLIRSKGRFGYTREPAFAQITIPER
jgi:hypothetical protein